MIQLLGDESRWSLKRGFTKGSRNRSTPQDSIMHEQESIRLTARPEFLLETRILGGKLKETDRPAG